MSAACVLLLANPTAVTVELRERAVLYVNGRLDRVVEDARDVCAGAVYAPFPELGKLTR